MARVFTDASAAKLISAVQRLTNDVSFSVGFWLYRTGTPVAARSLITAADVTVPVGWIIRLLTTNLVQVSVPFSTTDKQRSSIVALALNTWVHVLVTHKSTGLNSSDVLFYFDGKSDAGTSVANGVGTQTLTTATAIEVGASTADAATAAPANLGPIAIWNRALGPTEALALAGGEHPLRFKEGLIEVFDLDESSYEEGWLAKLLLVPGATNPTNAAVRARALMQPSQQLLDPRLNIRPFNRSTARYLPLATGALSATASATLTLISTAQATDPEAAASDVTLALTSTSAATVAESATAAATLSLTSSAVATDPESATASATLVLTSSAVATDPEAATAAATLALISSAQATDPEVATGSATLVLLSSSAATDPEVATAAATLALTSASVATDPEAATAAATLVLLSTSTASGGGNNADAAGTLLLLSASQVVVADSAAEAVVLALSSTSTATVDNNAQASALLVLLPEQPAAAPAAPVATGIIWGLFADRYRQYQERKEAKAKELRPLEARASARLVLVGRATATTSRVAIGAGRLRLSGAAQAVRGEDLADAEEALLLAMLIEYVESMAA
jgi:hypothetical protein